MKRDRAGICAAMGLTAFLLTGCGSVMQTATNEHSDGLSSVEQTDIETSQSERPSLNDCLGAIDDVSLTRLTEGQQISREDAYVLARTLCGYPLGVDASSIDGFEDFAKNECRVRDLC